MYVAGFFRDASDATPGFYRSHFGHASSQAAVLRAQLSIHCLSRARDVVTVYARHARRYCGRSREGPSVSLQPISLRMGDSVGVDANMR